MKRLEIDRKHTVWSRETIEYDDTKYTEEEFVNQFHRAQNGYSDVPIDVLYETYDYEYILDTTEDITPAENGNQPTLEIMDQEGDTLYDNGTGIYKGEKIKTEKS